MLQVRLELSRVKPRIDLHSKGRLLDQSKNEWQLQVLQLIWTMATITAVIRFIVQAPG
jgi:hypothetical protein